MSEPKVSITVMPGAQMNGYVKEQNNYFGTVQQIPAGQSANSDSEWVEAEVEIVPQQQSEEISTAMEANEELFHFVHPSMDSSQEWQIHQEVKRLVARFGIQDICAYLVQMKNDGKILLPQSVSVAYKELVRMGMSSGEGFNEKTFQKYYNH